MPTITVRCDPDEAVKLAFDIANLAPNANVRYDGSDLYDDISGIPDWMRGRTPQPEADPTPPHGTERHYSIDPTERDLERIADALERIARHGIKVDLLR